MSDRVGYVLRALRWRYPRYGQAIEPTADFYDDAIVGFARDLVAIPSENRQAQPMTSASLASPSSSSHWRSIARGQPARC